MIAWNNYAAFTEIALKTIPSLTNYMDLLVINGKMLFNEQKNRYSNGEEFNWFCPRANLLLASKFSLEQRTVNIFRETVNQNEHQPDHSRPVAKDQSIKWNFIEFVFVFFSKNSSEHLLAMGFLSEIIVPFETGKFV